MRFKKFLAGLLMLGMSGTVQAARIGDNTLHLGKKGDTTTDRLIVLDTGQIKFNQAANALQFSTDSGSSFKNIGSGSGGGGGINFLAELNFDFEAGDPPTNWTASAGTFVADDTNELFGSQSGAWTSASPGDTLSSASVLLKDGAKEEVCVAQVRTRYPTGSSGDYKLQIYDGSVVLAEVDIVKSDTAGSQLSAPVIVSCPSSGSLTLRLEAVVAGNQILVDEAFLGVDRGIVDVGSAEVVAHAYYAGTTNCQWDRTSTTLGDFSADADCPAITVDQSSYAVDTADNDLPDLDFDNLPPGIYKVTATFSGRVSATASAQGDFAISDGTDVRGILSHNMSDATTLRLPSNTLVGIFTYSTSGPRNFKLQAQATAGTSTIFNGTGTGVSQRLTWTVTRFPLSVETAFRLETTPWLVDVNIGGANLDLGAASQSAYVEMSNAGLDMVLNTDSKPAQIPCSSTNPSTGLTCSVGNESVGVVFEILRAGRYQACFEFSSLYYESTTGAVEGAFQVVQTPNAAQTITLEGKSRVAFGSSSNSTANNVTNSVNVCGVFKFDSVGQKTLRLMYEQAVTGTPEANLVLADRNTNAGQRDIRVLVWPLDQQTPQHVINNTVINTRTSGVRVESAQFDCSGSPTITNEVGSWVSGIVQNSTGNCTVTFDAGVFSLTPVCTISSVNNAGSFYRTCQIDTQTALSATTLRFHCADTAFTAANSGATLICEGAK